MIAELLFSFGLANKSYGCDTDCGNIGDLISSFSETGKLLLLCALVFSRYVATIAPPNNNNNFWDAGIVSRTSQ